MVDLADEVEILTRKGWLIIAAFAFQTLNFSYEFFQYEKRRETLYTTSIEGKDSWNAQFSKGFYGKRVGWGDSTPGLPVTHIWVLVLSALTSQ